MRAKRMQSMLCKGWIEGSGSSSAKAGMNGGFDVLCGRLVYYDGTPSIEPRALATRNPQPATRLIPVAPVCRGDERLWLQRLGPHRMCASALQPTRRTPF
jgi:hypothetical protein